MLKHFREASTALTDLDILAQPLMMKVFFFTLVLQLSALVFLLLVMSRVKRPLMCDYGVPGSAASQSCLDQSHRVQCWRGRCQHMRAFRMLRNGIHS